MSALTSRDRMLWGRLIASVLNSRAGPAKIRREAMQAHGCKERRIVGASLPVGHDNTSSPFYKLASVGRELQADDAITRQLLCDYAHQCRAVFVKFEGERPDTPYLRRRVVRLGSRGGGKTDAALQALRHRKDIDD